jgi:hypothetical protein
MPQPPQFVALVAVFTSQPFAALLSQFANPALQEPTPHTPAEHPGVPFATAAQNRPQAPQFVTLVKVFVSQPFATLPSQLANGALQEPIAHTLEMHARVPFGTVGHMVLQAPQLFASLALFTSQPLAAMLSQFRNVPLQEATPHTLEAQPAVPFAGFGQARPQPPQLATSEVVFTSQPFAAWLSQSPNPALHEATPQVLEEQPAVPFAGAGHPAPQPPQFTTSEVVSTSQPFPAWPSQLANPASHEARPQAAAAQPGVPFATAGQALPQLPQFAALVSVSTHPPAQQVPPAPQAVPQAPQCRSLVARSTHAPPQQVSPLQSPSPLQPAGSSPPPPPHPTAVPASSNTTTHPIESRLMCAFPRGVTRTEGRITRCVTPRNPSSGGSEEAPMNAG